MKSRAIKSVIKKKSDSVLGRIIVLTGARQTGKTTLVKNTFPQHTYLSIEDPILRVQYTKLTAAQWKEYYPKAILDEVQKAPEIIESIKSVYDQFQQPTYILLGSSQLLLLQKVKESLAGRCVILEVFPLTLPELITSSWDDLVNTSLFIKFMNDFQLDDLLPSFEMHPNYAKAMAAFNFYLKYGAYPALVNNELSDEDRYEWLHNYVRTYLERDIRDLADFKSLEPFIKTQRVSSMLTAQQLNYSNLGKEAGISPNTAKRFIEYMEISYQTFLLQPWHKNKLKRLVKTPKIHYLDPGIQKTIIGKRGALTGNEFESAIIAEIYKQLKTDNFRGQLYHLRTHDGKEIDLLIETEKGYIAIEVKQTSRINKTDAKHLFSLGEILDKPLIHSFIISMDNNITKINKDITAIPAAMFLS